MRKKLFICLILSLFFCLSASPALAQTRVQRSSKHQTKQVSAARFHLVAVNVEKSFQHHNETAQKLLDKVKNRLQEQHAQNKNTSEADIDYNAAQQEFTQAQKLGTDAEEKLKLLDDVNISSNQKQQTLTTAQQEIRQAQQAYIQVAKDLQESIRATQSKKNAFTFFQ